MNHTTLASRLKLRNTRKLRMTRKILLNYVMLFGLLQMSSCLQAQPDSSMSVVDFKPSHDTVKVKQMCTDHWKFLGLDDALDSSGSVDCTLKDERMITKVLKNNDKVVGFVAYRHDLRDSWYVSKLVVDTNYQKKGYGNILMQSVIDDVIEHGGNEITLKVFVDNTRACAFYKDKFGFKVEQDNKLSIWIERLNSFVFENEECESEIVTLSLKLSNDTVDQSIDFNMHDYQ